MLSKKRANVRLLIPREFLFAVLLFAATQLFLPLGFAQTGGSLVISGDLSAGISDEFDGFAVEEPLTKFALNRTVMMGGIIQNQTQFATLVRPGGGFTLTSNIDAEIRLQFGKVEVSTAASADISNDHADFFSAGSSANVSAGWQDRFALIPNNPAFNGRQATFEFQIDVEGMFDTQSVVGSIGSASGDYSLFANGFSVSGRVRRFTDPDNEAQTVVRETGEVNLPASFIGVTENPFTLGTIEGDLQFEGIEFDVDVDAHGIAGSGQGAMAGTYLGEVLNFSAEWIGITAVHIEDGPTLSPEAFTTVSFSGFNYLTGGVTDIFEEEEEEEDVFMWTSPQGGSFDDVGNWDVGVPSEDTHTALFDLSGFYTVTFPTDASIGEARVHAGDVSFLLNGNTLTIEDGDDSGLTVANGKLSLAGGMVNAQSVQIGGANGQLTITGGFAGNPTRLQTTQGIQVGVDGPGELNILDGTRVNASSVAISDSGHGTVIVDGTNAGTPSLFDVGSDLLVGSENAPGTLTVANGGRVQVGNDLNINNNSMVTVQGGTNGTLSDLTVLGILRVGFGEGDDVSQLNVVEGGRVINGINLRVGGTHTGIVTVSGVLGDQPSNVIVDEAVVGVFAPGMIQIDNGGVFELSSSMAVGSADVGTVSVDGVNGDHRSTLNVDELTIGSSTNEANGMLNVTNGAIAIVKNGLALEQGMISIQGAAGTLSLLDVGSDLLVGSENVPGALNIGNGGRVEVGNNLDISNDATVTVQGGLGGTPSDLTVFGAMIVGFAGGVDAESQLSVLDGGRVIGGGSLRMGGGTLGKLTVAGVLGDEPSSVIVDGAQVGFFAPGTVQIDDGGVFESSGSMAVGFGAEGTVSVDGVNGDDRSTLDLVELTIGSSVNDANGMLSITNGGLATVSSDLTLEQGLVETQGMAGNTPSTLEVMGNLVVGQEEGNVPGDLEVTDGAIVDVFGQLIVNGTGAVGGNNASIDVGSLVDNGGVINDGLITAGSSPGVLTIVGDLANGPGGVLQFEIAGTTAGTEHDQLIITGDAMIDGTVVIQFIDDFAPTAGQEFGALLDVAGTADSSNARFIVQNLAGDFEYDITPMENGFMLIALTDGTIQQPIPGDYDNSGQVEQADLDLVLLNWGASATPFPRGWINNLPGGNIDQDELDGVLLNWGATTALTPAADVPEPATLTVALLVVAASSLRRWKGCC